MLDKNFVSRKIKLIQEDLSRLEDLGKYSFSEIAAEEFCPENRSKRWFKKSSGNYL